MGIVVPFPSAAADGQRGALAVGAPRRLSSSVTVVERVLDWLAVVCGVLLPLEVYRHQHPECLAGFSPPVVTEVARAVRTSGRAASREAR